MDHARDLREKIEISGVFSDYHLSEEYAEGSNGIIYFANAKSEHRSPSAIALKTVLPQNIIGNNQLIKDLEREFGKWLKIPPHENILKPRGFKKIQYFYNKGACDRKDPLPVELPIMEMEWADGSLRDWITNERYDMKDRIIALIYAFNGLAHLYKHGFSGHGDLKPENILFSDATPKLIHLIEEKLQGLLPFIAKIADFGLSDIWEVSNDYHRGAREYLAPERLAKKTERTFEKEKSDIFSMGVIAAELILSEHPSKNLKKMKKSDGNWVRGCSNMNWDLDTINSTRIKDLITSCLNFDPKKRPSACEACEILLEELKEKYKTDLKAFINYLNEDEDTRLERLGYSTEKREFQKEIHLLKSTAGLSLYEDEKTAIRLEKIIKSIPFDRLYKMLDWAEGALMLKKIYSSHSKFVNKHNALILEANDKLINIVAKVDAKGLHELHNKLVTPIGDPIFSSFIDLVSRLTLITNIDFEQIYGNEYDTTDYFTSAFACSLFSNSVYKGKRTAEEFLKIAKKLNPNCGYINFKIAKYNYENLLLKKVSDREIEGKVIEVIRAIKNVKKLNPDWALGNNLLNSICSLFNKKPSELFKLVP